MEGMIIPVRTCTASNKNQLLRVCDTPAAGAYICVMFSTSSQMLRIIDEVGQSPSGAWTQNDFIREHARKRSVFE